jgi:hypothetical protein
MGVMMQVLLLQIGRERIYLAKLRKVYGQKLLKDGVEPI